MRPLSDAAAQAIIGAFAWTISMVVWVLYERYRNHTLKDDVRTLQAENNILTRQNELLGRTVDRLNKRSRFG